MKKILVYFFLFLAQVLFAQVKPGLVIPPNPKIGLSLAGGGAKGISHIGVLKIIDSLGIKIDYVAGTSMGSIVGGLYASGYKAKDIEDFVMQTDFYDVLLSQKNREDATFFAKTNDKYLLNFPVVNGKINFLPKAISTGQKNIYMMKELFRNVAAIDDFSKMPIPFMAVGTNLETGKMTVFEKGDLVSAIMASSAYPGLLDPVKIGDSLYIDGAVTINYPSSLLKEKGMDIVIGVDLNQPLPTRKDLTSALAILNQVIDFGIKKETENQYKSTDINIKPNLEGFGATSYGDKEPILKAGYSEAIKYIPILNQLPKARIEYLRAPINPLFANVYKIDSLKVKNNTIYNRNYIAGKMNLKIPSMHTYQSINRMIDKLYATNNFNLVNYDIVPNGQGNTLQLDVTEDPTRYIFKFGLHYDEVMKTGLLLNATIKRLFFTNSLLSVDAVFGGTPRYYVNYLIDNGYIPGLALRSQGMRLDLRDENNFPSISWVWFHNEASIQSIFKDKYSLGGGILHDYYEVQQREGTSQNFYNPFAFIRSDSRDDQTFPTRGIYLDAMGQLVDVFSRESGNRAILAKVNFEFNIPVGKIFTYQGNVYGGFAIGNNIPDYYAYRPGGIFMQSLGNFTAMPGYAFGSIKGRNLLMVNNYLQAQVWKNLFVTANVNLANTFEDFKVADIARVGYWSGGLSAGYRSPAGPIMLNYSKAFDRNNKGFFSVVLGHWF